jgi:hypothetical protein
LRHAVSAIIAAARHTSLARDEIAQAQAKGLKPSGDCAAEAAALALR